MEQLEISYKEDYEAIRSEYFKMKDLASELSSFAVHKDFCKSNFFFEKGIDNCTCGLNKFRETLDKI
jgi:hypothetical protein